MSTIKEEDHNYVYYKIEIQRTRKQNRIDDFVTFEYVSFGLKIKVLLVFELNLECNNELLRFKE